jgi:hypothetical protein
MIEFDFVGVVAIIWAIRYLRDDLVFEKNSLPLLCMLLFGERNDFHLASKALKVITLNIFAKYGWTNNNRLCL